MIRLYQYLLLSFITVVLLAGCSNAWKATKKAAEVIWDPNTPVGSETAQPSKIALVLLAEPDINLNDSGEATPMDIQVIFLREDSRLLAADYDQLSENSEKLEDVLGKNYIEHQDFTLVPNQFKPLPPVEADPNIRYIGVVGHYADANITEWKKIIKVSNIGKNYKILVHVRATEIDLQKEEE